ncbi:MAG: signal peptidase II [Ignavibacteriales bacterium]|nr:signal peptidase II [Ignavibacteriales bacterium]
MVILFRKYFFRFLIISISILFLVGCDQTTKKVAQSELKNKDKTEIAGIINLQYIENDGGMLSLGNKLPQEIKFIVFILLVSVFLIILFFYILKNQREMFLKQSALVLILSGGLGNLVDRVFNNGNVIDFIRIRLPLIESGIFNIADFYVTLGFVMILLSMILKPKTLIPEKTDSI